MKQIPAKRLPGTELSTKSDFRQKPQKRTPRQATSHSTASGRKPQIVIDRGTNWQSTWDARKLATRGVLRSGQWSDGGRVSNQAVKSTVKPKQPTNLRPNGLGIA